MRGRIYLSRRVNQSTGVNRRGVLRRWGKKLEHLRRRDAGIAHSNDYFGRRSKRPRHQDGRSRTGFRGREITVPFRKSYLANLSPGRRS